MQRPTAVTVFGILNLVFAFLGFVGVMNFLRMFASGANAGNPVIQVIQNNPGYADWIKVSIFLGAAATGFLLAAGVGLLFLKPWARFISIGYGFYAIVMVLASTVVSYSYVVLPMLEKAHHSQQGPEVAAATAVAVGTIGGGVMGLIYPVFLLIFMMRPHVVAAFKKPYAQRLG